MSAYTKAAVQEFLDTMPGAHGSRVLKLVDTPASTHAVVELHDVDLFIREVTKLPGIRATKTLTPLDTIWTFVKQSEDGEVYATVAHTFSLLMLSIRKD